MFDDEIPSPGALLRDAYRTIERQSADLFRIAVIPVFLEFLILILISQVNAGDFALTLTAVLMIVPFTLFDVAWLRHLLGAGTDDPPLAYRWTQRHTGFAGRLLLVNILISAGALPLAILASAFPSGLGRLLMLAGIIAGFYFLLRLSFFIVARAFDRSCEFMQSWAATKAGAGRFFWGAVFTILPATVVLAIVAEIANATGIGAALPRVMILLVATATFIWRALLFAVIARVFEIRMMGFRRAEF
jgi:hypothetical protein